jgi:hypothetical protein
MACYGDDFTFFTLLTTSKDLQMMGAAVTRVVEIIITLNVGSP